MNELYVRRRAFESSIKSIPKNNKFKFYADVMYLIDLAHEDNYNEVEITKNRD